jgi:hypothetical protein
VTLDEALRTYYAELTDDAAAERRLRAEFQSPNRTEAHRRRWLTRLAPVAVAVVVVAVAISLLLVSRRERTNPTEPGNSPTNQSTSTDQPWLVEHPAELLARLQAELPELGDRIEGQSTALSEDEAIAQVHGRYALGVFWWEYGDPNLDSHTPHPVWLIVG